MRWAALLLLIANLGVAGYLLLIVPGQQGPQGARSTELNADKVRRVLDAAGSSRIGAGACLEWGPFAPSELARAREQLSALQAAKVVVRDAGATPAWWVHVAPARNREEAERRVRELDELGVKDARVVTDDNYRNAISLGIFRTEEAAQSYQARMREIKVRNTAIVQRSDLLRLATIVIAEPVPGLAAKVVELRSQYPGSEVRASACQAPGS